MCISKILHAEIIPNYYYAVLSVLLVYSRIPLIRPPSKSHWCGRIRGMVAREGFRYAALLQQRHTKYVRIRQEGWSSARVVVRQFYCTCQCPPSKFQTKIPAASPPPPPEEEEDKINVTRFTECYVANLPS